MRIYDNFREAQSEIRRDLVEMGIRVHPKTYQDTYIGDNPDFETMELQNYIYTVINPDPSKIECERDYCKAEWLDRREGILGMPLNPGRSWLTRKKVWSEFLGDDGKFAYTYPERFAKYKQVQRVIQQLRKDPDSRQGFISVWDPSDVEKLGGLSRVPCSLGYLVQVRKGKVNLTYLQRSCDFATHMGNDMALAAGLQYYITAELLSDHIEYQVGTFTHWIGSLHIFKKDAGGVF